MVDDNPSPGGQIWRGGGGRTGQQLAALREGVRVISQAQVIAADPVARTVMVNAPTGPSTVRWNRLIIATGSRELFLPFPGWTLPGVFGAGGLQALAKSGLPVDGKRVVVAGSGPLLLAVAKYLKSRGARILAIVEQAGFGALVRFGAGLMRYPEKLIEASRLKAGLAGISYRMGCWIEAADGSDQLRSVRLRSGSKSWTEQCDFAAVGFGLYPNTELASLLGCGFRDGRVRVDELQETSVAGIYCAGEATGIGGVELAECEGAIAGSAAAGDFDSARGYFEDRERLQGFARSLENAFRLRPELKQLPSDDTFICRCEDVRWARVRNAGSWREVKLHTRCGMGPCQGRVCGPAVEYLRGWRPESVRPPIFPAPVGSLMSVREFEDCEVMER